MKVQGLQGKQERHNDPAKASNVGGSPPFPKAKAGVALTVDGSGISQIQRDSSHEVGPLWGKMKTSGRTSVQGRTGRPKLRVLETVQNGTTQSLPARLTVSMSYQGVGSFMDWKVVARKMEEVVVDIEHRKKMPPHILDWEHHFGPGTKVSQPKVIKLLGQFAKITPRDRVLPVEVRFWPDNLDTIYKIFHSLNVTEHPQNKAIAWQDGHGHTIVLYLHTKRANPLVEERRKRLQEGKPSPKQLKFIRQFVDAAVNSTL